VQSTTPSDPHGIDAALGKLMGGSRRTARSATLVAATMLADGEMVEAALGGRFRGEDAVVLLTDRRLILANSRQWDPEVVSIENVSGVTLEGWVERRAAIFRITDRTEQHIVDKINDTDAAEAFATMVRGR
jgi:hypothetical protein